MLRVGGAGGEDAGLKWPQPCLRTAPHLPPCIEARAAPTDRRAQPEHLGGLPWPQELASGWPKVEEFPLSITRYQINQHHFVRGPNQLFVNRADNGNSWLKVRLVSRLSEAGSLGAKVTVRVQFYRASYRALYAAVAEGQG